ncbi:MAG: hypothetical protein CVV07_01470 [Gammaproteobacteria bacterium HGW-Gammaproteobacteria-11]|nr:MAG: hypothetical protein CVV07_01470 [Gammaproteobacteria bacterium HGW-Gammaproteobacteria-11]
MPVFQAAWTFYLNNPALVINGLALFYALSGSWLLLATQIRASRQTSLLVTSPAASEITLAPATLRINRMFNSVGFACLGLALLLSLISTQV